jgi:hypothetical protein
LGKTIALRFEIVRFLKKPALYALKTLNFKLTLPSLGHEAAQHLMAGHKRLIILNASPKRSKMESQGGETWMEEEWR